MKTRFTSILGAVFLFSTALAADFSSTDPEFEHWKSAKPGDWVKMRVESANVHGQTIDSTNYGPYVFLPYERTITCKAIQPDEVTLEVVSLYAPRIGLPSEKTVAEYKHRAQLPTGTRLWLRSTGNVSVRVEGKDLLCDHYVLKEKYEQSELTHEFWFSSQYSGPVKQRTVYPNDETTVCYAMAWGKAPVSKQVPDPYYAQWKAHQPGSWIKMRVDFDTKAGFLQPAERGTYTSVSKFTKYDGHEVFIESTQDNGKTEVRSYTPFVTEDYSVTNEGSETIIAKGKAYSCSHVRVAIHNDRGLVIVNYDYWFNYQIPGPVKYTSVWVDDGSRTTGTVIDWHDE